MLAMRTAQVLVTNHAAERFRQRFDPQYSLKESRQLIEAAIYESKPAPKAIKAKVRAMTPKADRTFDEAILLYHFESSLVFVAELIGDQYHILTCYPVI
jgi:hypothetical protein